MDVSSQIKELEARAMQVHPFRIQCINLPPIHTGSFKEPEQTDRKDVY